MGRATINQEDAGLIEQLIAPWRDQIQEAATEGELLSITNHYLGRWPLEQLFKLPDDCRPCHVGNAEELSHWAFHLGRALDGFKGSEEEHFLLEDMALFFDLAYTHLSVLSRAVFEVPPRRAPMHPPRTH